MVNELFKIATPTLHTSINAQAVVPHLPDHDPNPTARAAQLEAARSDYQWDWNSKNATGVPLLKSLPIREFFSARWIYQMVTAVAKIQLNEKAPPVWWSDKERAKSIRDYADLFVILAEPPVAKNSLWATDESFGEQRLSGANPMSIEKVKSAKDITSLVPANVAGLLCGSTVEQEVAAGRLFVVDHRPALQAITKDGSVTLSGKVFKKLLPKCAALFWWNRWDKRLMPISILIGGPNPKLFSPTDTGPWINAKLAFQACDGVVHEMSVHLARTHLVMGGIAIAAKRQLADVHPIYRLLAPHFRFMLCLNQKAESSLIAPGSDLDVSFGAPIEQVVGVAAQAYSTWNFTDHAFPNDISRRGVGGSSAGLPGYAFRDDAALLWKAIEKYVAEYVDLYYSNDLAVAEDSELTAWAKEVTRKAPNGAAIKGFPALDDVPGLVFALTHIIFVCSVQHSAVNYTQNNYSAFAPNSPFATWASQSEKDVLKLLPPIGAAEGQLNMLFQLTAFRYDQLGDYAGEYSRDERANAATRAFLAGMPEIDDAISAHERGRWQSYEYLRPKNVLNSISI